MKTLKWLKFCNSFTIMKVSCAKLNFLYIHCAKKKVTLSNLNSSSKTAALFDSVLLIFEQHIFQIVNQKAWIECILDRVLIYYRDVVVLLKKGRGPPLLYPFPVKNWVGRLSWSVRWLNPCTDEFFRDQTFFGLCGK